MEDVQIIEGDALEVMASLPDRSFDVVLTDPPYGTGQWVRPTSGLGRDCKAVHIQAEWDEWDALWLGEALRIARGPVAFFLPNGRIFESIEYAKGQGLPWRLLLWCKTDPRPRFSGQTAFGFEPLMVYRPLPGNGGVDWFPDSAPRLNRDNEAEGHSHQKPVLVMSWLVGLLGKAGQRFLDPYCGTGSTGVACVRAGCGFLGIESDPLWVPVARRRLDDAAVPLLDLMGGPVAAPSLPFPDAEVSR